MIDCEKHGIGLYQYALFVNGAQCGAIICALRRYADFLGREIANGSEYFDKDYLNLVKNLVKEVGDAKMIEELKESAYQ